MGIVREYMDKNMNILMLFEVMLPCQIIFNTQHNYIFNHSIMDLSTLYQFTCQFYLSSLIVMICDS